jgi:hypothetical protein
MSTSPETELIAEQNNMNTTKPMFQACALRRHMRIGGGLPRAPPNQNVQGLMCNFDESND